MEIGNLEPRVAREVQSICEKALGSSKKRSSVTSHSTCKSHHTSASTATGKPKKIKKEEQKMKEGMVEKHTKVFHSVMKNTVHDLEWFETEHVILNNCFKNLYAVYGRGTLFAYYKCSDVFSSKTVTFTWLCS